MLEGCTAPQPERRHAQNAVACCRRHSRQFHGRLHNRPAETGARHGDQQSRPAVIGIDAAAERNDEIQEKQKSSSAEDFLNGWHKAYALVYDKHDYEGGIAALRAMGYDDNADVATLIGYASRKLGRYDDAKVWYERALAADPNHALTWSYYGMWQAEQGNILKAKDDLQKVASICGTTCREYTTLKAAIDGTVTY